MAKHPILSVVFIMLLFFYVSENIAGQSFAFVDRTQIGIKETVNFRIEAANQNNSPDVSVLSKDFIVLNKSKSSTINYVNSRMETRNQWFFTLAPKSIGTLIIPGVSVGSDITRPIKIKVHKQKIAGIKTNPDLFLEVSVAPEEPYVQSQITFTVRAYQGIIIRDGRFSKPIFDNAIVEELGEGKTFNTVKNSRRYRVSELQYAIFPLSSGLLTIPPVIFDGEIIQQDSDTQNSDLFGRHPLNRLFSTGTLIRILSKNLQVDVKPQAREFKGSWWLPAKNIELQESWTSDNAAFHVGQPVTRTIKLLGTGISSTQLPKLPIDEIEHASLYPEKVTKESHWIDGNLLASKQQNIVIIPTQSGSLRLPKIEIHWWDIAQKKARVANIPEKTINVLPAIRQIQSTKTKNPSADTSSLLPITKKDTTEQSSKVEKIAHHFPLVIFISGFFLIAWITTLWLWRRQYRLIMNQRVQESTQRQALDKET